MGTAAVVLGALGGGAGRVGALLSARWVRVASFGGIIGAAIQGLGGTPPPTPDTALLAAAIRQNDQHAAIAFGAAVLACLGAGLATRYGLVGAALMGIGIGGIVWGCGWFGVVAAPLLTLAAGFALEGATTGRIRRAPA